MFLCLFNHFANRATPQFPNQRFGGVENLNFIFVWSAQTFYIGDLHCNQTFSVPTQFQPQDCTGTEVQAFGDPSLVEGLKELLILGPI